MFDSYVSFWSQQSSYRNYTVNLYDGLDDENISDVVAKHRVHESIVNMKSRIGETACQFEVCKLSEMDVSNKIKSLKCGKSAGHDGIQEFFFKIGGENLAKSLCLLFNKCIDTCTFPMTMKMTEICPTYKKFYNLSTENYRSINLLIMFSDLFERLMAEQLTNYLKTHWIP